MKVVVLALLLAGCPCPNCPVCDFTPPNPWPEWELYADNPVLVASSGASQQGQDNVYAPDIIVEDGHYLMWYGAQSGSSDGSHDRIYLATSSDGYNWQKWPSGANPQPVLDRGSSNHVNDPSVVIVPGPPKKYFMYYTDAVGDQSDRVGLAIGDSPTHFDKASIVIDVGPGAWEAAKVGRPTVLLEGGKFRMWYDGQSTDGRSQIGYAESSDGVSFDKFALNPVLPDTTMAMAAVDVERIGGVMVMMIQGGKSGDSLGTFYSWGKDGKCWAPPKPLFSTSGRGYDAFGQVTPFLLMQSGMPRAVYFGGASVTDWNKNRIALAHPKGAIVPPAGCTACVDPGLTCSEACRKSGGQNGGVCASPGSADPGNCCACSADGCESCLSSGQTCAQACAASGWTFGACGNPGSTDPSNCCTCS
jgi:hypothetical protein